ncbi:S8 family serine peptidase, partial [Streptomyces sp. SID3343]|uniref:S8 family serine peptidase n=1 Tax=Streptomyces sp. SID3343 TaxID=2690260 RepID=UPI00136C53FC
MRGRRQTIRPAALAPALITTALGVVGAASPARADSVRAAQWYPDAWKIDEAWKVSRGNGITVAVIDTGVDATHPDLAGQVLPGLNASTDKDGHGTMMAGLIAGLGRSGNGQGAYGIAPDAKILPYNSALYDGIQNLDKVIDGIRRAADSSARIINLSIGVSTSAPQMADAVAYAQTKGKLLVAAGGNTPEFSGRSPVYPAVYPGVLGVSSLDRQGSPSTTAVAGSWISISGPGSDVPAACTSATRDTVLMALGGSPITSHDDYSAWADSLNHAKNWAVIEHNGLYPSVYLIWQDVKYIGVQMRTWYTLTAFMRSNGQWQPHHAYVDMVAYRKRLWDLNRLSEPPASDRLDASGTDRSAVGPLGPGALRNPA